MGLFELRDDTKLYPSCVSKICQPLDVSSEFSWPEVVEHCLGADASGLSGAIVNGWLLCDGSHTALNQWIVTPPL